MKRLLIICMLLGIIAWPGYSQETNLLVSGDFKSLKGWTANKNLKSKGKVTLIPEENGVKIYNPVIDLDGSLYQDVKLSGVQWLDYSVKIRGSSVYDGGGMMRASAGFIFYDKNDRVLNILTPTKVSGTVWRTYSGTLRVPAGTVKVRTLLSVLDGTCSYGDVKLMAAKAPEEPARPQRITPSAGFEVDAFAIQRPFWELFSDDLNGDGKNELIACDVDGIVTVRHHGGPAFFTYAPGALVYQFEAADLNKDGKKEILMSFVDPKIKVRAIDMTGSTVLEFPAPSSHERIATGDMDGDGFPEIALSKNNGIAGSGVAGGIILYDHQAKKLWENDGTLREFHFGDVSDSPGKELVVGGSGVSFRIFNKKGENIDNLNISGELLDHFAITDINRDGTNEIIGTYGTGRGTGIVCLKGKEILWRTSTLPQLGGSSDAGTNIATGDFDKSAPGYELALIGALSSFVFDASGAMIYQNRKTGELEYWASWADRGINSLDIAFWNESDPRLYLSSSRFRQTAYYSLTFGDRDEFGTYLTPDQDKHLEDLYNTLKKQPALQSASKEKIKVFMATGNFAEVPEEILVEYRKALDKFESENVEYLVMYEASDLYGHERGQKMTTDEIVSRAALFEKTGIPFGYFSTHGGQVWISDEAIRRSKEVAPKMFRFLYIAENLETLYSPLYKDVLAWTNRTLDFCAEHNMKMIFKEKHDVWGLLPSDPEVSNILFSEKHKSVTVPIWSTNQPYQPEVQLGGMLGLKNAGLCEEFGMSTQYWNWHEWGRYPRGIRDVSPAKVCPHDIILRLDLLGIALGGTWIHIEGGQTYFESDVRKGLAPPALRHRDLAYELVRKNILTPGAVPLNINNTALVRSFHSELEKNKQARKRVAYPYYDRNTEPLRKGFIPARYLFETYTPEAFPWIGYNMAWNSITCFPETPNGWITVLPPAAKPQSGIQQIFTDGEKIKMGNVWKEAGDCISEVTDLISSGASDIPFEAPGTSMVIHKGDLPGSYILLLIDPGYLAPSGVETVVKSVKMKITGVTDLVTGEKLKFSDYTCPVKIKPGAFSVLRIELK